MLIFQKKVKEFQNYIFDWWRNNVRDLPWRHTHDPYKIWISEVMLQQTQVSRILPRYAEFIDRFPSVESLAQAKTSDVLRLWKGIGYNRRALYLKKGAEVIMDTHKGIMPNKEQELLSLPGIGTYTARAILVFAYKQDVAMVDTNIRQIITHFFFQDAPQTEKNVQYVADQLVPKGKSWEWHQALMDYGALRLHSGRRPERSRRTVQPFRDSNRFYRGRIMDLLREKSWKTDQLIEYGENVYHKPKEFLKEIIQGLEKDGLIVSTHKTLALS